jgi:hypothetical protein
MKKMKIFTFIIVLVLTSFGMSGQYLTQVSTALSRSEIAVIDQAVDCQASFSALPDSLSTNPFLYHFKDLSQGNINAWYWDFGDGSSSLERNPSHQFEETGTFKVCLTVADQNDTSACFDQVCQDISTLEYFSLGGLVYAGEYPLNNPEMAGDTGIASLYRIVNNEVIYVEEQQFTELGYYWFGFLLPDEYLVKIALTGGSTHYNEYFTTYFGDNVLWTKANPLTISSSSLYEAEVHLFPVQDLENGTGIIRGYVKFEQDHLFSMPPMAETTVILADKDNLPLKFTHPNNAGYFEFNGLPFNLYYLSADATGKPASAISVTLSEESPLVEGINLTIFGSNANNIPEGFKKGIALTRIYPNPVKDKLHIRIYSDISSPIGIKIMDVTGKIHFSEYGTFETGLNEIIIPIEDFTPGIYLLMLQPQGNFTPVTAKFIK